MELNENTGYAKQRRGIAGQYSLAGLNLTQRQTNIFIHLNAAITGSLGKTGFNTGDLKYRFRTVWDKEYAQVWRLIRNLAKEANIKGHKAMVYWNGKYYFN